VELLDLQSFSVILKLFLFRNEVNEANFPSLDFLFSLVSFALFLTACVCFSVHPLSLSGSRMASIQCLNPKAELARHAAALELNINGARGLQEVMRSNLGPKGTLKMYTLSRSPSKMHAFPGSCPGPGTSS
jgi:hypothetical protein